MRLVYEFFEACVLDILYNWQDVFLGRVRRWVGCHMACHSKMRYGFCPAYAARAVVAICKGVTVNLAVLALQLFASFMWFFCLDFRMTDRCEVEYRFAIVVLNQVYEEEGTAELICRCCIFTICSTERLEFSNADFISSHGVDGWSYVLLL